MEPPLLERLEMVDHEFDTKNFSRSKSIAWEDSGVFYTQLKRIDYS